ncbi:MAG: GNAT family N-acetyltransferase [Methanobrevibacter sp.]|nr:GNAT family N-acetyltransferase [Methanobrevibacter sp.]
MEIRNATIDDFNELYDIEKECFPPLEAVGRDALKDRLNTFPNHFWLITENEKIVSFINGLATDLPDLIDEMYEDTSMHDENGDWQMIFGLNTLPEYRKKGYAGMLVNHMIEVAKQENRLGVVLTCKEHLVSYYSRFGFMDEGKSDKSHHAGEVWNQMRIKF